MNQLLRFVGLALFTASVSLANAGTKSYVGAKVSPSRQVSMDRIDHAPWGAMLKKYVDADGNVDYQSWKTSRVDSQSLDRYLQHLSTANTKVRSASDAKLAFWINAYNAVTVRGILKEYPTTSIRKHTAKLIGYNIWHDLLLRVGDDAYSLYRIEHEILRKAGDPRIHFAIVCASRGCPRLLNEAYDAQQLQVQLESIAKDFFARQRNFRYDRSKSEFHVSSILKWFAADFGKDKASQWKMISRWLPSTDAKREAAENSAGISYLKYDWSLNDQPTARTAKRR